MIETATPFAGLGHMTIRKQKLWGIALKMPGDSTRKVVRRPIFRRLTHTSKTKILQLLEFLATQENCRGQEAYTYSEENVGQ